MFGFTVNVLCVLQASSGRSKQERRWERKADNRMTFDENYDW